MARFRIESGSTGRRLRTRTAGGHPAFTLVELLVVISIIALLIGILLPSLAKARKQARSTLCLTRLHTLGQGLTMYAVENADMLLPGRMPRVDDDNWRTKIAGGIKYRPTFLAMMGTQVGIPAFDDPQASKLTVDRDGQPGDQQNYSSDSYVCPVVSSWTDERNGCYGYNYQFLGNSRLFDTNDVTSFKNWPIQYTRVRSAAACVAVADSMGTAASFPTQQRQDYEDNGRDALSYGNEGFNLDPPRVDPENGEMANFDKTPQSRSSLDPRHLRKGNVLWLDGHCSPESLQSLGYKELEGGVVGFEGNNRFFSIDTTDRAWTVNGAGAR